MAQTKICHGINDRERNIAMTMLAASWRAAWARRANARRQARLQADGLVVFVGA